MSLAARGRAAGHGHGTIPHVWRLRLSKILRFLLRILLIFSKAKKTFCGLLASTFKYLAPELQRALEIV